MAQPVSDEALQLRKRARRRLVGAIALVAVVVLVLPWFLDNRPPEPLKNVEIVIPPVPPVDKQFPKAPDTETPPATPADGSTAPPSTAPMPGTAAPAPAPGDAVSVPAAPPPVTAPTTPPPEPDAKPADKPQDKPAEKPPEKPVEKITEKPAAKPPEKSPDKPAPKTAEKPKPPPKTKPPAPEKPAVAKVPPGKGHVIQLGAYSSKENASQLLADLRAAGFPGYIEPVKTPDGTKTRVRCGPFPTPEAAQAARTKLIGKKLAAGELKVVQAGQ